MIPVYNTYNEFEVRKLINDSFSDLNFEKERHIYTVNGEILISVSKLVGELYPPFDKDKWLKIKSRELKIEEEELNVIWENKKLAGQQRGTITHDFLENYTGFEKFEINQQKAGIDFLKQISEEYNIIGKEIRGYSKKYRYAGTLDILLQHKETKQFFIGDYKTNENLFKNFGYMNYPVDYLENHSYNHYQMQLSFYQIFLQEIGIPIQGRKLIHLKEDATFSVYDTYDYSEILEVHLKNRLKNENRRSYTKSAV